MSIARARKAVVGLVGLAAQVVAAGAVPERYQGWGAAVIALATALGVYAVPNQPPA